MKPFAKSRSGNALFRLALLTFFLPQCFAAEFRSGKTYTLPPGESVSGNLYAAGGELTVSGDVQGDLVAAGGTILVPGTIGEDALLAGGEANVMGHVEGDVRMAGGRITVAGSIGGDLVVAGGRVRILPGATVGGDLIACGGNVAVEGTVGGNVRAAGGQVSLNGTVTGEALVRAGTLRVGPDAVLRGPLQYWSSEPASISESATLSAPPEFHTLPFPDRHTFGRFLARIAVLLGTVTLLGVFAGAALGFLFFRRQLETLVRHTLHNFGAELLRGFAIFLAVPVLLFLVSLTVIGIPVALFGGLLYAAFSIVACLYAGIVFGSLLFKEVFRKADYPVTWGTLFGGIGLLFVVLLVPVAGALTYGVFFLVVFGALFHFLYDDLRPGGAAAPSGEISSGGD